MTVTKIDGPRRGAASGSADTLIVFVHGYGANGQDLFSLSEPLASIFPNAAFAAPDAPQPCVVNPMGYQWFSIPWIDGSTEAEMREGFNAARLILNRFLDDEIAQLGVAPERLALFGFSQGAMMCLQLGPVRDPAPTGIIASSGRLADADLLRRERRTDPPIQLIHGDQDDVVPYTSMADAKSILDEIGLSRVETHTSSGMAHGIAQDGLIKTVQFLQSVL
jgi:phospholipase/carboxylesterase